MALQRRMWHSVYSDGFRDGSGKDRAVYHVCLCCRYLRSIMSNYHESEGKGKDENGKARKLCQQCLKLLKRKRCCAVILKD